MSDSEKLSKAKACCDKIVNSWNRTYLTDIEKWSLEEAIIWGVFDLALYLLSQNDYQKLKDYVWQTYGFNVGGALGKFKGEYADEEA